VNEGRVEMSQPQIERTFEANTMGMESEI